MGAAHKAVTLPFGRLAAKAAERSDAIALQHVWCDVVLPPIGAFAFVEGLFLDAVSLPAGSANVGIGRSVGTLSTCVRMDPGAHSGKEMDRDRSRMIFSKMRGKSFCKSRPCSAATNQKQSSEQVGSPKSFMR